jgi:DNA repair photolyase
MVIREIKVKGILSKSKVYEYVLNAYTGCQHGCTYCYARFMKRFTGHLEPWGKFVDVKINARELLQIEITRKKPGTVWVSGVCDPYQPLESRYRLTRQCLEILIHNQWPVVVQTRSPLVLRDLDLFKQAEKLEVGMSVPTADESIRRLFEPEAPTIKSRIKALEELHKAGIRNFVMIAPLLPGAEGLGSLLKDKVDRVLIDRMNYHHCDWVYKENNLQDNLSEEFFRMTAGRLDSVFKSQGIETQILF